MIEIKVTIQITLPDGRVVSETVTATKGNRIMHRPNLLAFWLFAPAENAARALFRQLKPKWRAG